MHFFRALGSVWGIYNLVNVTAKPKPGVCTTYEYTNTRPGYVRIRMHARTHNNGEYMADTYWPDARHSKTKCRRKTVLELTKGKAKLKRIFIGIYGGGRIPIAGFCSCFCWRSCTIWCNWTFVILLVCGGAVRLICISIYAFHATDCDSQPIQNGVSIECIEYSTVWCLGMLCIISIECNECIPSFLLAIDNVILSPGIYSPNALWGGALHMESVRRMLWLTHV